MRLELESEMMGFCFFLTAERQGSYIRCWAVDGALVLINEVHS